MSIETRAPMNGGVLEGPRRWRRALLAASLAFLGCTRGGAKGHDAGAALAPHAAAPPPPPAPVDAAPPAPTGPSADLNVLLLTVDSLRADMPWAGYPRPIAPRLEELEKRAVSYTRGYAISSYTSMSVGGFLGGKLPGGMRRDGFFFGTYHKDNVMFPELLQKAGIATVGAHAHGYFKDGGFHQGFDKWEIVKDLKWDNTTDVNVTSPQHEALAEKLLGDPSLEGKRIFAWFHMMDPHDQYIAHEPEVPAYGKTIRDRYDAEVTYTDKYIGKLIDFVASRPWGAKTAIVVTADHGEALGEHKQYSHGFELWENLVRVPLFFVLPGVPPRHIATPRGALDLAPTICELMGVAPDPAFEGKSLVPELYGGDAEPRDVVLDLPMTSDNDRRRGIVRGDLKVIAFGADARLQVFDLATDPDEASPLLRGPEFDTMRGAYVAFEKSAKDLVPYGCLPEVCLNGAYKKPRDAGASP